jgi:hypothetical protein
MSGETSATFSNRKEAYLFSAVMALSILNGMMEVPVEGPHLGSATGRGLSRWSKGAFSGH